MDALAWDPEAAPIVALLTAATVLYTLKHYLLSASRWQTRFAVGGLPAEEAQARGVLARRISAGALLGLGMLLAEAIGGVRPVGAGLRVAPGLSTALWVAAALAVVGPLLWRAGKGSEVQAAQPEIRAAVQPPGLVVRGWAAWAIYLLGYEYLFRGALVIGLAPLLGVWPTLAVSTAIYTLVHLPKPLMGETIGSIAMGFLFGAMALHTGAIWAPWLVHLGIVVVAESSAGRHNPAMRWWR